MVYESSKDVTVLDLFNDILPICVAVATLIYSAPAIKLSCQTQPFPSSNSHAGNGPF